LKGIIKFIIYVFPVYTKHFNQNYIKFYVCVNSTKLIGYTIFVDLLLLQNVQVTNTLICLFFSPS